MANKTILVAGYGPGISNAVAEKFGAEGYAVALAARNEERLQAGVKALEAKGIRAAALPTDLADIGAARGLVKRAREQLGPIGVLHWNAYATGAGDLTTASDAELGALFDLPIASLLASVQEALPDLRTQSDAAILVTNGGLGFLDPQVEAQAIAWNVMGLAIANAAKQKLVSLLSAKLAADDIYVGEVVVTGTVKGTAFDSGNATLDPANIAEEFWKLSRERTVRSITI